MKKAFILLLVVLMVITGLPVPMAGMGTMSCADCPPGVRLMAGACLAVLTGTVTLMAAALVLTADLLVGADTDPATLATDSTSVSGEF